jgi:hypothetical protein
MQGRDPWLAFGRATIAKSTDPFIWFSTSGRKRDVGDQRARLTGSELQESLTDRARLYPTDRKLLPIREDGDMPTAGHHADLGN